MFGYGGVDAALGHAAHLFGIVHGPRHHLNTLSMAPGHVVMRDYRIVRRPPALLEIELWRSLPGSADEGDITEVLGICTDYPVDGVH